MCTIVYGLACTYIYVCTNIVFALHRLITSLVDHYIGHMSLHSVVNSYNLKEQGVVRNKVPQLPLANAEPSRKFMEQTFAKEPKLA